MLEAAGFPPDETSCSRLILKALDFGFAEALHLEVKTVPKKFQNATVPPVYQESGIVAFLGFCNLFLFNKLLISKGRKLFESRRLHHISRFLPMSTSYASAAIP
jgi:hypothetical protein